MACLQAITGCASCQVSSSTWHIELQLISSSWSGFLHCLFNLHLVRWLPSQSQSPKRQMGLYRRIPPPSLGLCRRAIVCFIALLGRMDSLSECPLGCPSAFRNPLWDGLFAHLHGNDELPYRCLRNLLCQCFVSVDLYAKYFRCLATIGHKAHIPPARGALGVHAHCLPEPCSGAHPICVHSLWRPHSLAEQILPGAKEDEIY